MIFLFLLQSRGKKKPFVEIRSSIHSLERIAASVNWNEPVLLVGETGTGKTTLVQDLAMRLGQKLTVLVILLLSLSPSDSFIAFLLILWLLTTLWVSLSEVDLLLFLFCSRT